MHEALPVMAAQAAAPDSIAPAADREMRHGLSSVPVMYDLRFAVSTLAPTLVRVAPPLIDRPAFPLAILPPQDSSQENAPASVTANDAAPAESTVAAIEPETPAVISDAPAEPPAPKTPALAAIDTQAKPDASANWPAAETPAPEAEIAALEPQAAPPPAVEEPLAVSEPAAAAETPTPLPEPVAAPAAVAAIPEPTPEVATPEAAAPEAAAPEAAAPEAAAPEATKTEPAKPVSKARAAKSSPQPKAKAAIVRNTVALSVVHKKHVRIRTANTVTATNPFGTPPTRQYGIPSANPFGAQNP
jgi:hypothetical protein